MSEKWQERLTSAAAYFLAVVFVWWPLFMAIHPIHQMSPAGSEYTPQTQNQGNPEEDGFWSFKIGDVATWVILIVQAFIFAVQAYLAHTQRDLTKGQVKISDQQRLLMERQAGISERQADAAEMQNQIALQQLDIITKQKEIARQDFLVVHRPRLVIRHVSIEDSVGQMAGHPGFGFNDGDEVRGALIIQNSGGGTATITRSEYRVFFSQFDTPPPGVYVETSAIKKFGDRTRQLVFLDGHREGVIETGGSLSVPISGIANMTKRDDDTRKIREFSEHGWYIFVMGQITYADDAGRERFIGFCRRSDLTTGFRPVEDPDYEYQD